MDARTKQILTDEKLVAARDAWFDRLRAVYADSDTSPVAFCIDGRLGVGDADPYTEPEAWVHAALEDVAQYKEDLIAEDVFHPLCIEYGIYGVHYADRIFGARSFEIEPGNWQVEPISTPVGELPIPDLDADETWLLTRRAVTEFIATGVTVPVFGLPTIASALNVGMNLYGQELLMAFITDPDALRRDLKVINDILCRIHQWFLDALPLRQLQPVVSWERTQCPGYGQICGCSCQLVSAGQYAEFIAPLDDALLSVYPHGGMLHLCGGHTQHIPAWNAMESLRCVQLNDAAAEELEVYWNRMRDDITFYVNLCPGMPVEKVMDITGGRRVVIVGAQEAPLRGCACGSC